MKNFQETDKQNIIKNKKDPSKISSTRAQKRVEKFDNKKVKINAKNLKGFRKFQLLRTKGKVPVVLSKSTLVFIITLVFLL